MQLSRQEFLPMEPQAGGRGVHGRCIQRAASYWARSRRERNRAHRAMHGNLQATALVANVTSLKGAWPKLLAEQADLLVLQEVRCTAA